jgi:hypothetical protein
MAVPEAAVNEDDLAPIDEDDVGRSWQAMEV